MKEKKKLGLPAWIFIGMLAGIVAGLIFAFAGLGDFTTEWIKPIGCTELPIVADTLPQAGPFVDPTAELAKAAIRFCGYRVKE